MTGTGTGIELGTKTGRGTETEKGIGTETKTMEERTGIIAAAGTVTGASTII